MRKLGCTLQNLAKICLHKSTTANFYLFTERDKNLLEKTLEHMVGGLSIVYKRRVGVYQTFFWGSTILCKNIVGIDASQLYLSSTCQAMTTGLYKKWELDSESSKTKPRQNKTGSFENMVMSYFQRVKPQCKVESLDLMSTQKKIDAYCVDGFCGHCITVFEPMG